MTFSATQYILEASALLRDESVEGRQRRQESRMFHPLTCGNGRCDERHSAYQAIHGGDFGQLVAVEDGWLCPVCNWKQDLSLKLIYGGDKAGEL